jgi:hypothetical protein
MGKMTLNGKESEMKRVMDVKTVSNEEIQNLFEESFENQVAKWNDIDSFDVKCVREIGKNSITIEVTVMGTAGCPTAEDFKKSNVDKANTVTIERADKGELLFTLIPEKTVYLNYTEYIVIYKS